VPALGFGTWQLTGDTCYDAVLDALHIGYTHVDTARMYNNEEEVGRAIKDHGIPRGDLFLTSKIWLDDLSRDKFIAQTENSLKALGTDYLDLLLIHWPNPDVPVEETFDAMAEVKERGLIKHGGLSNFPSAMMEKALGLFPVFCNQVEYHFNLGQDKLLGLCEQNDIMLTAYCPLGPGNLDENETLVAIGQAHGKSPYQVALRWLLQQPQVTTPPRSSQAERRRQNFDVFDFELSEEEMQRIRALPKDGRKANPPFAPEWD